MINQGVARCTGRCCRRFPLGGGIMSLVEFRARVADQNKESVQDGPFIADMLIEVGLGERRDGAPAMFFTCRHHDAVSGDCTVYDQRPRMCSEFPYGSPCVEPDCTAANRGVRDDLVQLRMSATGEAA